MGSEPIGLREAIALALEVGENLGGRYRQAMELLVRVAQRDEQEASAPTREPPRKRPSSGSMKAIQAAANTSQHFAQARAELAEGQRDVKRITERFAAVERGLNQAESNMIEASHALLEESLAQEDPKK